MEIVQDGFLLAQAWINAETLLLGSLPAVKYLSPEDIMTTEELAENYWEVGAAHYQAGRISQALVEWRSGLQADPAHAGLRYNLGLALWEIGQRGEAVAQWHEATRLQPDFYEPYYHLVIALTERLRVDEAGINVEERGLWREMRDLCRQALGLDPPSQERTYLLRVLSAAEWELGDKRQAQDAMQAAIRVEPDQWAYERLIQMQLRTGQWRAFLQTTEAMFTLPDLDFSCYQPCVRRLQIVGTALLCFTGGVLLIYQSQRRGRGDAS